MMMTIVAVWFWPILCLFIILFGGVRSDSAPKWEWEPPESLELAEEESVDLHCPARGRPQPLVRWTFNAQPFHELPDDGRRMLLDGGRLLRILHLKRDLDTGLYECNATNREGHLAAATFLNVQAFAPRFGHSTQRVWKVLRNARVDLNCAVQAAPKPEVHWVDANDTQIQAVPGKLELLPNHTLRLHSVSSSDDGFYYCNVSNKYGLNRAMNRLEVFNPTFFTEVPQPAQLVIDAFDTVELRCRAVADSRLAVDYVWTRNGRPTQEKAILKDDGTSILELQQVRGRASGRIECAAVTDVDVKVASMELLVRDVPEPPVLLRVDCSSGQHALLMWRRPQEHGSPLTAFTVDANGEGNAGGRVTAGKPRWEKVFEERLAEGMPAKQLYKTAIPLQPWMNYTFRIFAHNEHGASEPSLAPFAQSSQSAQCATPEAVPFQNPEGVKVGGNEPDNLVIGWRPLPRERWNAPGLKYLVRYRRMDLDDEEDGQWTEFYVEDPFANQTVIREQPTFRPYQVQVRAINSKGFSAVEPTIVQGWSGEDGKRYSNPKGKFSFAVPLEAPRNLRVERHYNFSSVSVHWEPVSENSIRGHFRGYRLDFWLSSRPHFVSSLFASNSTTSLTVSGLEALHNYTARVVVINGQYESAPSNLLQFRTLEGAPSKVHNLRVHAVGARAILATWEPPLHPNGNLRGYFLAFENGTSGLVEETYVLHRQQFYLEQLTPHTPFRVAVWAETGGGEDPDVPLFTVRPSSATSLRIHWLPAGNGTTWRMTGTSFAVNYTKQDSSHWTLSEWITLPQTVLDLGGLAEGTDYWLIGLAKEGPQRVTASEPFAIRTESTRVAPPFSQERLRSAAWFLAVLIASALVLALAGGMCALAQRSANVAGTFAAIKLREKRFGPAFRIDSQEGESGSEWTVTELDGGPHGPLIDKRKAKAKLALVKENEIKKELEQL